MSIPPLNLYSARPTRRGVIIGLAASSLPAPAIVRVGGIMPIRSMVVAETGRPSASFAQLLFYNALTAGIARGRITVRLNNRAVTLHEAERLVRNARQDGWINDRPSARRAIRIGKNCQ
ncbi:hypothetical protein ABIF35_006554 [Bradyrhizobium japonicum]|uniref:hypothetical protein n=1 Tax=Bradyrhizobium diazoefficiens TaxID=1355477 RepID=UPI00348248F2